VIGSRGYRFMRRLLLGGVAGALVQRPLPRGVRAGGLTGGPLIALPRCARSALRAGAVSMIRSQARSPLSLAALGRRFARALCR
jgi:hypothetical protein